MDRIAHMVGEKVGDAVEGAVKHVLGVKDTDKKKGGGLSLFGGNKKEEPAKQDEGKGGFFSKLLDKGDKDKGVKQASGFSGLFAEQQDTGAAGETDEGVCEYTDPEGPSGGTSTGFYDDLLDVAAEMSTDK